MTEHAFCQCGCGKLSPIAPSTRPRQGWIKGEPMPFYPHHRKNRWPVSDGLTKMCRECRETKQVADFAKNVANNDGLQNACRECSKQKIYSYRNTTGGKVIVVRLRQKHHLKNYKITPEQFEAMLLAQDWRCAICRRPEMSTTRNGVRKRLAIDHCHKTGVIRGLLCQDCNQGLGKLGDDPERLEVAAAYIRKNQA